MRSVMATAAAAWFVFGAVVIGDGSSGTIGAAPNQAVIGDPVVMAIHLVARIAFVGFALLTLAFADVTDLKRLLP